MQLPHLLRPTPPRPIATTVLGKGELAIRIAEWFRTSPDHALERLVPVIPEPTWTDSLLGWGQRNGVETIDSGDYRDIPPDASLELVMSVFYDRILDARFLRRCGRALNLHNAPLPRYRGVSPINWALKNGEVRHGVTLHEITREIDAGPILAQVWFPICPESDEVIDVYRRALEHGWELFTQTMAQLPRLTARPQDESLATYYSAADDERLGDRRLFTRAESQQQMSRRSGGQP